MAAKNSSPKTPAPEQQTADIAPATTFSPSGAPEQVVPDVNPNHPAVDNNPREGTTIDQNKIDFNDPTKSDEDAVADNLRKQDVNVADKNPRDSKSED
ncbi:hypothetical protein [Devosia aurantiaca]|uniref:Uncharacterized protein n=1 Tax=Devosia aurantiaca TaxID=2714858 RepID=A0A6M1SYC9_9HYPH|nr:hypothetical protein [Devosia aurantiaca]NGP19303.1 hypothetical protein [Devosia aurantiaca]